jgi:hypothetical protein
MIFSEFYFSRKSEFIVMLTKYSCADRQRSDANCTMSTIRCVYLKRIAPRNPGDWEELEFAAMENDSRDEYFRSIDRYHLLERPGLAADLVLGRTGQDKEVPD